MAEKETICLGLELSDGGHVYLKSTWETTNFSIVVLDGVHAWSRAVSAKEVVSIAISWKIDVGEFIKSARSHLCHQHPTSSYSISAEKDADVAQLSFTIDDLLEGNEGKETLNFDLRLTRISEVGAVVRDMLDHVLDAENKLKEQLAEAEKQFQKKLHELAATEPEPSITLSLARSSVNPRRQSSLVEPRLLDFTKFNRSEERDPSRSVCTLTPMRAHEQQLQQDIPKVSSRLPLDLQDHGINQMANSTVEMEREPVSFYKNLPIRRAVNESRMGVRNNDLTVRAREAYVGSDIPLSPNIMRVLNNLSATGTMQRNGIDRGHGGQNLPECRDEGEVTTSGGCDERGVKITEMRSPGRREEQSQRSFMVERNSVSIDLSSMTNSTNGRRHWFESKVHEEEGSRRTSTILRQKNIVPEGQLKPNPDVGAGFSRPVKYNGGLEEGIAYQKSDATNSSAFSEKKKLLENFNRNDVNGGILEKGSSNAGEPGRSLVRGLKVFAEGEAKEGSDEEPTSKATTEDVHLSRNNSDSDLRAKTVFSEKARGQWSNEARSTEEHENYQEQQKLADKEPRGPVRNEFPDETRQHSAEKRSLESLWSKDVIGSAVMPSRTKSDKKSLVTDTLEYARHKSSCSNPPVMQHQGRKRTVDDREDELSEKALGSVKLEVEDPDFEEPEGNETYGSARGGPEKRNAQKFNRKVKHEVVDLDELYPEEIPVDYKKSYTMQIPDVPPGFARNTIADLLKKTSVVGGEGRGRSRGRGRGRRRMLAQPRAGNSPREKRQRRRLRGDRSPSEEGNVLDPDETNVDNFIVPDPDYYNFDKERTEDLIFPNQIWAVYDEKDGFPRVWACIDKVSREPKFEVSITWLTPYNPSADAENWFKTSGYPVSCGKFERGSEAVLDSINMFSHRMEFEWVARDVVTIYPRKGEVWALYTTRTIKSASATPDTGAKCPRFRVIHILEDVEPEKRPVFSVLEKVKGFRTVYKANYEPGSVSFSYLVLFSHRVPAYQLQGNEGPMAANLKGSWDVDPAGLPNPEGAL